MMTIYLDADYKCHAAQNADGTWTPYETDFFDNKGVSVIEGYRIIPKGEHWTSEDGTVFGGDAVTPWKPTNELEAAQSQYEADLIVQQDMENALAILLGGDVT